ncbi:hypothetical protein BN1723_019332, partial [Verticillium longisporum]
RPSLHPMSVPRGPWYH